MHIFFIRHGESTGNIENRYGGTYDDHLTEKGREQATALAEELKNKDIEILFSSPLLRARETADILGVSLGIPVIQKQHLKERDQYGTLTGMNREEARKLHPDLIALAESRLNTLPGAESYENFNTRIQLAIREIMMDARHDCAAVVTHGGPMRVLFREILKTGEIRGIEDCAFAEIEKISEGLEIISLKGIMLERGVR